MPKARPDKRRHAETNGALLPLADDVRAQLARIIESAEFAIPERGRTFLRYIVDESLDGRADRIKAYSVAIEVFKRAEGFTQDDPVVRIEAGRLRRALERYYFVAGQADPIRIDLPKGGYVPTFAWNAQSAGPAIPTQAVSVTELPPRASLPASLVMRPCCWRPDVGRSSTARATGAHAGSHRALPCRLPGSGSLACLPLGAAVSRADRAASSPDRPTLVVAPFADLGGARRPKSMRWA